MVRILSTFAIMAAAGILLSQPAFAKLGDKAKQSAEPSGYTCKSGKAVRGKKGCKEYGGTN
jgi:hypothetical protein